MEVVRMEEWRDGGRKNGRIKLRREGKKGHRDKE